MRKRYGRYYLQQLQPEGCAATLALPAVDRPAAGQPIFQRGVHEDAAHLSAVRRDHV